MNYFGLKTLTVSDSLFTIVYQATRAIITRALFIFYTWESSSIVSRAASFLSASFRLSELPRTAEKKYRHDNIVLDIRVCVPQADSSPGQNGHSWVASQKKRTVISPLREFNSWKIPPVSKYFSSLHFFECRQAGNKIRYICVSRFNISSFLQRAHLHAPRFNLRQRRYKIIVVNHIINSY